MTPAEERLCEIKGGVHDLSQVSAAVDAAFELGKKWGLASAFSHGGRPPASSKEAWFEIVGADRALLEQRRISPNPQGTQGLVPRRSG